MVNERYQLKYQKIRDIISDVADCANDELILVGGTALALFHIKHRISVDLDFVPTKGNGGNDIKLKEKLKGCISSKGYQTQRIRYQNQFAIQFENTGIKVEVFCPEYKIKKIEKHKVGESNLLVASVDDILEMKKIAYKERKASRDLFDIFFILKDKRSKTDLLTELINEFGPPENVEDIEDMVNKMDDYNLFKKVIQDANSASN
jgi:predicted nucleotidyltransferase component of viral defense system